MADGQRHRRAEEQKDRETEGQRDTATDGRMEAIKLPAEPVLVLTGRHAIKVIDSVDCDNQN